MTLSKFIYSFFCSVLFVLSGAQNIVLKSPLKNAVFQHGINDIEFLWEDQNSLSWNIDISTTMSFATFSSYISNTNFTNLDLSSNPSGVYFWRTRSNSDTSVVRSFNLITLNSLGNLLYHINGQEGVTATSNNVSSIANLAGSNFNATQSNPFWKPELIPSIINNQDVFKFGGATGSSLSFMDLDNFSIADTNFTIISAYKQLSLNSLLSYLLGSGSPLGGVFTAGSVAGGYNFGVFNGPGNVIRLTAASNFDWGVKSANYNKLYNNGINSSVISGGTISSLYFNTIGVRPDLPNLNFHGYLGDVLVYNEILSLSNRKLIEDYIKTKYTPYPDLGSDQIVCGTSTKIGFREGHGYSSIVWSNGVTNSDSITITQNGTYHVTIESFGWSISDTIVVGGIIPKPTISLNSNQILCYGDSVEVSHIPIPGFSRIWTNGDTSANTMYRDSSQIIQLSIIDSNNCIASSDDFILEIDSIVLKSTLGPDRNTCLGTSLSVITSALGPLSYSWSTGDTTSFTSTQSIGFQDIFVEMTTINNCVFRDTISINALNLQAPNVNFESDTVCLFSPSSLLDLSTAGGTDNIISWNWQFPSGDSSLLQNPQFSFQNYNSSVTLTVETDSSCSNSIAKTIPNHLIPIAEFVDFIACAQDSIQLSSNSGVASPDNIDSFQWLVENVNYDDENPLVYVSSLGNQVVRLIVETDKLCKDTVSRIVEIFPALLPDFEAEQICIGDTTLFTDITPSFSIIDRTWIFDFFGQTSTIQNPRFYYPNPGTYDVKLSLTNAIGCQSEIVKSIEIRDLPEVGLVYDNTCEGAESAIFDVSSTDSGFITSQTWIIDGEELAGDSVYYTFENLGFNPVFFSVTDNFNCTNDTSILISVYPLPQVDFDFSPNYGEAPIAIQFENLSSADAVDFLWSFGENNSGSLDENPTYTYTQNGIYNITLVASNLYGCSDSLSREIPIIPTELDVELSSLSIQKTTLSDGSIRYTPRVLVKNVGSRAITTIDLLASIDSESKVAETWEGLLTIGQAFVYEFSAFFIVPNSDLVDYLCVEAANVNDNTEINFSNNKVCEIQNGLIQSSNLYPNPTQETVFMDVITTKQGQLKLDLYDLLGRTIFADKTISVQKGYNQISIDCRSLQAGEYLVRMIYQDEVYSQTLIITNK